MNDVPPIFRGNESSNPLTMPTKEGDIEKIKRLIIAAESDHKEMCRLIQTVDLIPKYELALWECVKLSGTDTSGGVPTEPTLDVYAVQEVKRLRDDHEAEFERQAGAST